MFKITGVHLQYVQSNTLIVRKLYTFSVCRIQLTAAYYGEKFPHETLTHTKFWQEHSTESDLGPHLREQIWDFPVTDRFTEDKGFSCTAVATQDLYFFFLSTNKSWDASVEVYSSNYIHMLNTLIFFTTMVESLVCGFFYLQHWLFFTIGFWFFIFSALRDLASLFIDLLVLYITRLLILSGRRNCLRWLDAC